MLVFRQYLFQYDYNFEEEKYVDDDGDEYEVSLSKTRRYNVKKKKKIKESVEDFNVVEQLLELENIEIDFEYIDGRVLDDDELEEYFGTTVIDDDEIEDSLGGGAKIFIQEVYVKFYINNKLVSPPSIYFITKNNKVIGVSSHSRFTDIATSFRYIPYKILNSYFIERAKTYLEEVLSDGNYLNAQESITSDFIFIRPRSSEFNYSENPSFISGSTGEVLYSSFINNPQTYITTIGLYNDTNQLLAVAKLSRPLPKDFTKEALIQVKLDY